MAVPTYAEFIPTLLDVLAQHLDGVPVVAAYEAVAHAVGLTPEDRAILVPSGGQPVYKNRIGWAHDSLKRVGWSSSPKYGIWRLTFEGVAAKQSHPRGFTAEELREISRANANVRMAQLLSGVQPIPTDGGAIAPVATASPDELIETALQQIGASVAADLLERMRQVTPDRFESLVLDLLHGMGYGTSRSDLQRVGKSGDEGIDGIISLDKLGLQKVYVQAKRWQGTVGSPEIQTFMGALQLQGAERGVFITSSDFSRPAREAAGRARGTIILVDGQRLAALMIEHGVGVTHKALRVPKVDGDFFVE
jgi:restriction system protein